MQTTTQVEEALAATRVACPACTRLVPLSAAGGEAATGRCDCGRTLMLVEGQGEDGQPFRQVQIVERRTYVRRHTRRSG